MHMKLDMKCPTCGSEYAADTPMLIELMTEELADMAKRMIKKGEN